MNSATARSTDEDDTPVEPQRSVYWNHLELARMLRIRFETTPGFPFLEVREAVGVLKSGEIVRVDLPFTALPRRMRDREGPGGHGMTWMGAMLDYARRDDVFLKGLGIFDRTIITVRILNREGK